MILYRYRAAAVLLVLGLFTVGSLPTAGQSFPGALHWVAHLVAYGLIAFAVGLGWRNLQATFIVVIVAALGVVHELTEIITHRHGFELGDAVINGFGALCGVAVLAVLRKFGMKS